jgi:hypothetical protein
VIKNTKKQFDFVNTMAGFLYFTFAGFEDSFLDNFGGRENLQPAAYSLAAEIFNEVRGNRGDQMTLTSSDCHAVMTRIVSAFIQFSDMGGQDGLMEAITDNVRAFQASLQAK